MTILSTEEYKRYSKQLILENIGLKGQKQIKNTKVLVIGAGGLGNIIMMYLAVSGIGIIGIVDGDIIEYSNLNRQILYNENDITDLKVITTKKKLKTINKNCNTIIHQYYLNKKNIIEIINYYDIIVDATDNFNTRHIIDEYCYKLHKTYIYGAINEFEGQIATLNYKNGIRYNHIYSRNLEIENNICIRNGVMGITTGYTGILQAIETIKIVLGLHKKCKNFLLSYNIINLKNIKNKLFLKRYKKQTLNAQKLKINKTISTINRKHILIDLRNASEFNKQHKNNSINIPLYKLKLNQTIKLIKYHSYNREITLYCNNNERSIIGSYILNNYEIVNSIFKD
uniref:Molybdopterin biosynthesis protein n=1 Tax=Herposiphonia versicolor TaxID=2007163 RepID=A0A1Z1MG70_9FLOR|nr:Molybdopterin biosynthesis protein [Herposiphonia versicolor]ARW64852.1 Molybdopterin biosynthesis protein [Herposiphonia versicolor]